MSFEQKLNMEQAQLLIAHPSSLDSTWASTDNELISYLSIGNNSQQSDSLAKIIEQTGDRKGRGRERSFMLQLTSRVTLLMVTEGPVESLFHASETLDATFGRGFFITSGAKTHLTGARKTFPLPTGLSLRNWVQTSGWSVTDTQDGLVHPVTQVKPSWHFFFFFSITYIDGFLSCMEVGRCHTVS